MVNPCFQGQSYPSWFYFEFRRQDLLKLAADINESELCDKVREGVSPVRMGRGSGGLDSIRLSRIKRRSRD